MSDDFAKLGPADAANVNIDDNHEVRYWTKKYGVSADVLKAAVEAVGKDVLKVNEYFRK